MRWGIEVSTSWPPVRVGGFTWVLAVSLGMRCPRTHHQGLDSGLAALVAGSPHPLGPWLELCRLSEASWFEAIISLLQGRRRWWWGQHNLSITVITGGFYGPVMGSESGQLSVLLSQFGDLLMGGGGGVRC